MRRKADMASQTAAERRRTPRKTAPAGARKTATARAGKAAPAAAGKTAPARARKTATTGARKAAATPARKRSSNTVQGDGQAPRLTPEERAASGKAARATVPLEAHAEFEPQKSRDPVGLLLGQDKTRVPDLVPIRHGRMLVSPFTFYRGAAPRHGGRSSINADVGFANAAMR